MTIISSKANVLLRNQRYLRLIQKTFHQKQQVQYSTSSIMSFNFGSAEYTAAFHGIPKPDVEPLRKSTIEYLDKFDPQLWYNEPITSIVNGKKLEADGAKKVETLDAFGVANGSQYFATPAQVSDLKDHIVNYKSKYTDLRTECRKIEQELLTTHAGFLIGNQCVDFGKQDGITEMEESTMANVVEQRLNDLLLRDEVQKKVSINRKAIYVSCVSNFTNFLDLFRKTLRSIEVGIPCIVLGRSNTVQHSYRWTELLTDLLVKEGIDPGMLTYLSCSLDDIKDITQSCQQHTGNLYSTCSRELAAAIKAGYPNTITSTGGPNTLVVAPSKKNPSSKLRDDVKEAIQMSATIESSGQCTALRHCVVPASTPDSELEQVFASVKDISTGGAPEALRNGIFDGVNRNHKGSVAPETNAGYKYLDHADANFKIKDGETPPVDIDEYWRKVVVDFTRLDLDAKNTEGISKLAKWLNATQPISLAINSPRKEDNMDLAVQLFDRTGMVVYTVGNNPTDNDNSDKPQASPALTCQARPQEAEIFGEFPPRNTLTKFTKYPVVVPSSTPSYDASYTAEYLKSVPTDEYAIKSVKSLLDCVSSDVIKGYCNVLLGYLQDATKTNPKVGFGVGDTARTALWGLQKPPLDTVTYLRCNADVSWDYVAPVYLIFYATTARDAIELSVHSDNKAIIQICEDNKLKYKIETDAEFEQTCTDKADSIFNVLDAAVEKETIDGFPMVGPFTSLYLPLGHIKSTLPNDEEFKVKFEAVSKKWIETLF